MDDKEFHQLLEFLGLSRQGYRKVRKGVKKRVGRHMQQLDCRNMREYLDQLEQSEDVRNQCARLMSVSISRFFRDKRLWQVLESRILPELIETHRRLCGHRVARKTLFSNTGSSAISFTFLCL